VLDWLDDATDPALAHTLVEYLVSLSPKKDDKAWARVRLLALLAHVTVPQDAGVIADALVRLGPEQDDRDRAGIRVLALLEVAAKPSDALMLAETLGWLRPQLPDPIRPRRRVLDLLASAAEPSDALMLGYVLRELGPGPSDTAGARARVLNLLRAGSWSLARELAELLAGLDPVAEDLLEWASWGTVPPLALLSAARRNSPLQSWLDVLWPGPTAAPLCRRRGWRAGLPPTSAAQVVLAGGCQFPVMV